VVPRQRPVTSDDPGWVAVARCGKRVASPWAALAASAADLAQAGREMEQIPPSTAWERRTVAIGLSPARPVETLLSAVAPASQEAELVSPPAVQRRRPAAVDLEPVLAPVPMWQVSGVVLAALEPPLEMAAAPGPVQAPLWPLGARSAPVAAGLSSPVWVANLRLAANRPTAAAPDHLPMETIPAHLLMGTMAAHLQPAGEMEPAALCAPSAPRLPPPSLQEILEAVRTATAGEVE